MSDVDPSNEHQGACWCQNIIRHSLRLGRDQFPLEVPERLAQKTRHLDRLLQEMEAHQEFLSIEVIANRMGVEQPEVRELIGLLRPYVLLSTPLGTSFQFSDTLHVRSENDIAASEGEIALANQELTTLVQQVLSKRDASIVLLRHGVGEERDVDGSEEVSFDEIGRLVGLSGERVRQIYVKSIEKLKTEPAMAAYRALAISHARSAAPDEIGSWYNP